MHKNDIGLGGLKKELGFMYTLGKWSLLLSNPTLLLGYGAIKCAPAVLKAASSKKAVDAYCQVGKTLLKTTGKVAKFTGKTVYKGITKGYKYLKNKDWSKVNNYIHNIGNRVTEKISNLKKETESEINNEFIMNQPFQMSSVEKNYNFEQEYNNTIDLKDADEYYSKLVEEINSTRDGFEETDWDIEANDEETIDNISIDNNTDIYFTKDNRGIIRKYLVYNGNAGNPQSVTEEEYVNMMEDARKIAMESNYVNKDIDINKSNKIDLNPENKFKFNEKDSLDTVVIDNSMEVHFKKDSNGNINKYYYVNGIPGNPEIVSEQEYKSFISHANRIISDREKESSVKENLEIQDDELSL